MKYQLIFSLRIISSNRLKAFFLYDLLRLKNILFSLIQEQIHRNIHLLQKIQQKYDWHFSQISLKDFFIFVSVFMSNEMSMLIIRLIELALLTVLRMTV